MGRNLTSLYRLAVLHLISSFKSRVPSMGGQVAIVDTRVKVEVGISK